MSNDNDPSGLYDPAVPGSAPHAAPVDDVETVVVHPEDGKVTETAKALLDAADDPRDVEFTDGGFRVPADLADRVDTGAVQADGGGDNYDTLTVKQLRAEIKSRNDARSEDDEQLDGTGRKDELADRLRKDDEAHAE